MSTCSCSKQISAGVHFRPGEILLLFGFAPCECINESVDDLRRRAELYDGTAIAKSLLHLHADQLEGDIVRWACDENGDGLVVCPAGIGRFMTYAPEWLRSAGISCSAGGGLISFGRRLYVRSASHSTPMAIRGTKISRAWVHASAPARWHNDATAALAVANGALIQWA